MIEEQQAVAESPDEPVKPESEVGTDAREQEDDLDALLNQYDTQTQPAPEPKPETVEGTDSDLKYIRERMDAMDKKVADSEFRSDMNSAIKQVRGELSAEILDDGFVEAYIDGQARGDPRLAKAWSERHANPQQYDKVLTSMGRNLAKKFANMPDAQATEDREAVTAAVSGASKQAPEGKATEYSGMSDGEYRESVKKEFGFSPV